MDWDRTRRFDDHRGGESYRPGSSRAYGRRSRSPPRTRSPPSRLVADTWVPSTGRAYTRPRSRSPLFRRRSRSPQSYNPYNRDASVGSYPKTYTSRRFSPRRNVRPRSPMSSSRRPRSPFGEHRARDIGWSQGTLTSRQARDSSSGRDYGYYRKERRLPSVGRHTRSRSPLRHGPSFEDDQRLMTTPRTRSPFYGGRRDTATDRYLGHRRRSQSPNDPTPKRPSAPSPLSNSRRSSPFDNKINIPSRSNRSRSPPASLSLGRRRSRDWENSLSQNDRMATTKGKLDTLEARCGSSTAEQISAKSFSSQDEAGPSRTSEMQGLMNHIKTSYPSNAPSQPKAFSCNRNKSPPPGLPHGYGTLLSHPRASNISLLSAPTRPRGSSNFKDGGWVGTPIRRGPVPVGSYGTPIAPRSNLPAPGAEAPPSRSCRHSTVTGASSSHPPRYSKYLVGLTAVVPGGKLPPSEVDNLTEKRLSQLDTDKDRLFEQIAESQKLKRDGLRDWDRLDRESSICALKSELAEGHLQCITDSSGVIGRVLF
ncbi:hypothetical protein BDW62DRAFT_188114 [Aspergillus aurantiobrunneus]